MNEQDHEPPARTVRPGIPPVVFSSPGAVDDPEPMPSPPPRRRQATTRRRDR
ncbi:hypothetical protein [Actinoplanes sp. NPDC023714]|uniref:hypothetical protein n=1 Tax=Actinoplanes sp. NPDC023714 TaxID=3154322 RepID=UPI0033D24AD0